MTKEDKQIQFLNRLYTNIENYKTLRFQLPITVNGLILAICGFVMNSNTIPQNNIQRFFIIFIVLIVGIMGLIAFRYVHNQYKDLAENIHYLWDKLGMTDEDFIQSDKKPDVNPRQLASEIFKVGYFSIAIILVIGICIILLK